MIAKSLTETHYRVFRKAPWDECGAIGSHGRDSRWAPANEGRHENYIYVLVLD